MPDNLRGTPYLSSHHRRRLSPTPTGGQRLTRGAAFSPILGLARRCGGGRVIPAGKEEAMRLDPGVNFGMFLLFFGVAALDTVREGDWLGALFWLAIALVFLRADLVARREDQPRTG